MLSCDIGGLAGPRGKNGVAYQILVGAIDGLIGASACDHRSIGEGLRPIAARQQVDQSDTGIRHRLQFAGVADAILVEVAPNPELAPTIIVQVKDVVVVRVEGTTQTVKIRGRAVVPKAEGQLPRLIDFSIGAGRPVGTEINRQEAVLRTNSGCFLCNTISIPVEAYRWAK
jgi:hypothetical protein